MHNHNFHLLVKINN